VYCWYHAKGKILSIPVILIGHINKEGSIAGPKVLEHIVDTVLQFEGDRNYMYRILEPVRIGSDLQMKWEYLRCYMTD
jgi:predicted ATP-dependent serine protease